MRFYGVLLAVIIAFTGTLPAQNGAPRISAPAAGSTLRGLIEIRGATRVEGFTSAEVAYAYADDDTWFLIAQSSAAVTNGLLARWDTTAIADGDYRLRLLVTRGQDAPLETIVVRLRVRNENDTTAPVAATLAPLGLLATPTALPDNPAQISAWQLGAAVTQGMVITLFVFLLLGVYALVRRAARGA